MLTLAEAQVSEEHGGRVSTRLPDRTSEDQCLAVDPAATPTIAAGPRDVGRRQFGWQLTAAVVAWTWEAKSETERGGDQSDGSRQNKPTLYRILSSVSGSVTVFSNMSPTFSSFWLFDQLSKVPVTKTSDASCDLETCKPSQLWNHSLRDKQNHATSRHRFNYRRGETISNSQLNPSRRLHHATRPNSEETHQTKRKVPIVISRSKFSFLGFLELRVIRLSARMIWMAG